MPRIEIKEDIKIDYFECGEKDKAPLLLLHGWSDTWRIWEACFVFLKDKYRIICPTQRGFGDSDKPLSDYSMKEFCQDLAEFLRLLEIEKTALVGHSMGGFIAHQFALENQNKISHLGLIGTAAKAGGNKVLEAETKHLSALKDPIEKEYFEYIQLDAMRKKPRIETINCILYECAKTNAYVLYKSWLGMLAEDHSQRLKDINIPCFIAAGRQDIFFPPNTQEEMKKLIPHAEIKLYEKIGHGVQWEIPEIFSRDLDIFLQKNI